MPAVPKNFNEVDVQGSWALALNKKQFLLHQETGMLIFATDQGLEFLIRSKSILSDGTFKTAPPPFLQIYTLFGATTEWKIPVVWALLGSKTEEIYSKMFEILIIKGYEKFGVTLMPELIVTDYESGIIPAIKKIFFVPQHNGCWFHFSQRIYRKFQDQGLALAYQQNPSVQNVARRLFSLPFIPPNKIPQAFNSYENTIRNIYNDYPNLEQIINYVKNFWIHGHLPLEFWNVFDRPVTMRKTNKCENWNRGWNNDIGTSAPNFWKVLKKLGDHELESRLDIRRISRGEPARGKEKKYRNLDHKILRLKYSYLDENISLDMYWDGIATVCRSV